MSRARHLLWLLLLLAGAAAALTVGEFSTGSLAGWQEKSLAGHSRYRLVELGGRRVLHASCDGGASVLYRKLPVDLVATPVMSWSWRVERVYSEVDERSKAGDDYPARVYVVVDGGLLPWRTRALNYVWASVEPVGATWNNAFVANAKMLALRSGDAEAGRWQSERRNVREDFSRLHGEDVKRIDGVALMTDCDNTGGTAEAWYGDIRFEAE